MISNSTLKEIKLKNLSSQRFNYIDYFKENNEKEAENEKYQIFSIHELKRLSTIYKKTYIIIDVRSNEDYSPGNNISSYNIPLTKISQSINLIKSLINDRYPMIRCNNIQKSLIAYKILKKHGINASILNTRT